MEHTKRLYVRSFFSLLTPLFVLLCLGQPAAAQSEDELDSQAIAAIVAMGETIADEKCGRCHALGSTDKSPHEEAPPFREVAKRYPIESLAEALAEGILTGHPDMPVIALPDNEIDAFLTYLDSLNPQ